VCVPTEHCLRSHTFSSVVSHCYVRLTHWYRSLYTCEYTVTEKSYGRARRKFIKGAENVSELSLTVFKHIWELILAYFPYFEEIKLHWWDHHAVSLSFYSPMKFCECLNQSLCNLYIYIYIKATEPISAAYLINPCNECVRMHTYVSCRSKATA
jgi:hypothetical protein